MYIRVVYVVLICYQSYLLYIDNIILISYHLNSNGIYDT